MNHDTHTPEDLLPEDPSLRDDLEDLLIGTPVPLEELDAESRDDVDELADPNDLEDPDFGNIDDLQK